MNLYINKIFHSLQGETSLAGFPSLFIRLAGCNLNCKYCDTDYALSRENSKLMSIDEIMEIAKLHSFVHHVTITGGEPLIQKEVFNLIKILCDYFPIVQVETNGSISIAQGDRRVRYIVDVKTPSSSEQNSFNFENINLLNSQDEVKFLIIDENDYNFAKEFIREHLLKTPVIINFSPVWNTIKHHSIVNKILKDNLNVRLNIQLHKLIGFE